MDNSKKPPSILSFCSGYGGIELGLKRVFGEINVLAHVEIEAFAVANLLKNMEEGRMAPAPIWEDLKTLNMGIFRDKVQILTGGYPCQPFSQAGNRLGEKDPRHLWPFIRRAIDIIRPRMCFFENVEGHITAGLYDVLDDLGGMGYRTSWGMFSAAEVGAPHKRNRVFIMANADGNRFQGWPKCEKISEGLERSELHTPKTSKYEVGRRSWDAGTGSFVGMANGHRDWADRLKLLGNGVVPQVAELAFRTLFNELDK